MADASGAEPHSSIAALPPTTVRQLGSSQILIDPSSVVKELIDNALDARANAIFVDVAANTIDSIQVKDTGHGIPHEDRLLVCRRYCTSKIRDFRDVKEVGGKWLGFRGEAMASMAEMSGRLEITTRVDGESVAVKLKYKKDGKLDSVDPASAPVGTTVKVSDFFKSLPVRKQAALKEPARCLAKIRRLIQAHALARPAVRFNLRVLKASSNKVNLTYAPKKDANIEDAALKVVGRDCALQCDWTAMETDDCEIHAFLPKPGAIGTKIANEGAFISVDARPMSHNRGTLKQVVKAFKERFRRANTGMSSVKDPFFFMNIICPPGSYDPNIEPAKDDVLFESGDLIINAVNKILVSYYPETLVDAPTMNKDCETPTYAQQPSSPDDDNAIQCQGPQTPVHNDVDQNDAEALSRSSSNEQPQWRLNMYGVDEEDLAFISKDQTPIVEEEEGRRSVAVSNPWTIARMNASTAKKKLGNNDQLVTPVKEHASVTLRSSSPALSTNSRRQLTVEPLTPQTVSRSNVTQPSSNKDFGRKIQRSSHHQSQSDTENHRPHERSEVTEGRWRGSETSRALLPGSEELGTALLSRAAPHNGTATNNNALLSLIPRQGRSKSLNRSNAHSGAFQSAQGQTPFKPPRQGGSKRVRASKIERNGPNSIDQGLPQEVDRVVDSGLYSENNSDIRNFFGKNHTQHMENVPMEATPNPSFTPINKPLSTRAKMGSFMASNGERTFPLLSQRGPPIESLRRATSVEPQSRFNTTEEQTPSLTTRGSSLDPPDMAEQLRAYVEREAFSEGQPGPLSTKPYEQASPRRGRIPIHNHIGNGTELPQMGGFLHASEDVLRASSGAPSSPIADNRPSARSHNSGIADAAYLRPNAGSNSSSPERDMTAQLRTYEEREKPTGSRFINLSPSLRPHNQPTHETASNARLTRRRTTDGARRTRSFKLPLERVPQECHMQNIILPITLRLHDIASSMKKLDMSRNSLEWGYLADEGSYDTFSTPVTKTRLRAWAEKIDGMLDHLYERRSCVNTLVHLKEGICKGLYMRSDAAGGFIDAELQVANDELGGLAAIQHGQVLPVGEDDSSLPNVSVDREEYDMQENAADEFNTGSDEEMLMDL